MAKTDRRIGQKLDAPEFHSGGITRAVCIAGLIPPAATFIISNGIVVGKCLY